MKPIQTQNKRTNKTYAPCRGNYHNMFPTTIFHGQVNLNHKEVANHCRDIVSQLDKGDRLTE